MTAYAEAFAQQVVQTAIKVIHAADLAGVGPAARRTR